MTPRWRRWLAAARPPRRADSVGADEADPAWEVLRQQLAEHAAGAERARLDADALLGTVQALIPAGILPVGTTGTAQLWSTTRTVARRLIRQHHPDTALALVELVITSSEPPAQVGLHALAGHARLSLGHPAEADLLPLVADTLAGADAALAADDLPLAAELVVIGAGLLLHRDLHIDQVTSPLVEDPRIFLRPLRESRTMALLTAPRSGADPESDAGPGLDRHRPRIVVLTGAYPRFSDQLVEALPRATHDVEVIETTQEHPPFRHLGTDPELVLHRLRVSTGTPGVLDGDAGYAVPPGLLHAVRQADIVVADWADKGAVWASLAAPPTARFVVRVHGADALSLWIHLLDWSRVDQVLSVSPHQAGLVDDVLRHGAVGRGPGTAPCRAVPNVVRLALPADPPPREPWTLGLVGWARTVKDPLWALEVLAALRRRGEHPWRLVLVGDGFAPGGVQATRRYAECFQERVDRPDLADAVELAGYTQDVAAQVTRLGFILSSSLRESFHLGLVEGVLGGAAPVVRDWPFFASRQGAATLFPPEWVVEDVDAAVERIWALRDPARRADAARTAGVQARTRFDPARTARTLGRLVIGDE